MSDPLEIEPDITPEEDAVASQPATYRVTPKEQRVTQATTYVPLATVASDDDYARLKPGQRFTDPEGKTRQKPFEVKGDNDYRVLPEGAQFLDPEGNLRQKPTYEEVDFTTQTLFNMATNDKERRNALARAYGGPGAVKQDPFGDWYVEDQEGKRRKPKGGAGAFIASEAAPVAGSIAGGVLGAPAGLPGAMGGAAVGGGLGQGINDAILALAGVYDRTLGEQALTTGIAAASGGIGEGVGRAVATGIAAAGGAKHALPTMAARYTGADVDPAATQTALRLAEQGVKVPPSAWMKETPAIHTVVEEFDPVFRTQLPLKESALKHYETKGNELLDTLGIPAERRQDILKPSAGVSTEEAGQAVLARTASEMAARDAELKAAMDAAKLARTADLTGTSTEVKSTLETLREAHAAAKETAQNIVDEGFIAIQRDIDAAKVAAKIDGSPGEAARLAAGRIRALRAAVTDRASQLYNAADAAAGDVRPNIGNLPEVAQEFLGSLPAEFAAKHPDIAKKIAEMRPGESTFGQLRNLRSLIRQDIDYNDLLPSIRDGAYKRFAGLLDNVLHEQQLPELKTAAKLLDDADSFYADNMKQFRDKTVGWLKDSVEAGMPPNAEAIAQQILTKDQSERIAGIRRILGPGLWNAVQHADTQAMINASQTTVPGVIDGMTFAQQVAKRVQDGVLKDGYSKELADKVLAQANRVLALNGKIPVSRLGDDTLASIMNRLEAHAVEIDRVAKADPLGTLTRDMKRIEGSFKGKRSEMMKAMRDDPLGFLYEAGAKPIAAANRIINDPDLFIAAARKFGEDSPEFQMLRQAAAQRLLQTEHPEKILGKFQGPKMPESVQQLIFPGVAHRDAVQLAKDMDFLMSAGAGYGAGGSIAAKARVLHPTSSLIFGDKLSFKIPGVDVAARAALGNYYKAVTWGATHPTFIRFVADGLRGTPEEREAARAAFRKIIEAGGAVGAAAGAMTGSNQ